MDADASNAQATPISSNMITHTRLHLRPRRRVLTCPSDSLEALRAEIVRGIDRHTNTGDQTFHNWGTVLAITASTAATIIPVQYPIAARVCAGVATLIIAISRSSQFGSRWAWHRALAGSYDALLIRFDTRELLPEQSRQEEMVSIRKDLTDLLQRESEIPGTHVADV